MNMTLRDIQKGAAKRFPFAKDHYPDLPDDKIRADLFAQKHLLLHLNKNLGAAAQEVEPRDHYKELASTTIPPSTIRKMIVNAIRLADVSGVSMQDLQASIDNWIKGLEP